MSRIYENSEIHQDSNDVDLAISSLVSALLHFSEQYMVKTLNDFGIGHDGHERFYLRKQEALICLVGLESPIKEVISFDLGNKIVDKITLQIFKDLTSGGLFEEISSYNQKKSQDTIKTFISKLDKIVVNTILTFNK